ncbi:MAG: TetR/AcrR family transcriptional regulator C-terminal domain-containing protein [Acidimicrobiia bacterium]
MTTTDTAARRRLDRRQILEAALAAVDRDGLEALSMRRLGSDLGVDPMAIYHHVDGKDRLLDGLAELLWEEIAMPEPAADTSASLRTLARSLRDLFRRHPEAAPLILRCTTVPRSELELFQAYLEALAAGGLSEPATVLRPVISYAIGTGYTESTLLGVQCGPRQTEPRSEREMLISLGQALPRGTPPGLASAALAMIADCDPERCFEEGLELMLAGLAVTSRGSRERRRPAPTTAGR